MPGISSALSLQKDELRRRRGGGGGPQIPNWERGLSRLVAPQSFKSILSIAIRLNLFLATSHSQIFNLLEIGQHAFSLLLFVSLGTKTREQIHNVIQKQKKHIHVSKNSNTKPQCKDDVTRSWKAIGICNANNLAANSRKCLVAMYCSQVRNLNGRGINEAKHNSTIRLHLPDPQIG